MLKKNFVKTILINSGGDKDGLLFNNDTEHVYFTTVRRRRLQLAYC